MNYNISKVLSTVLVLIFLGFTTACNSDDGQRDCNPEYTISASFNVTLPLYSKLESRGWVIVEGEGTGLRGLIVVKTSEGSYKAFDRRAPHLCPGVGTTLEVVDDMIMYCPADGAEWMLYTGQPIKIANRAPRAYPVYRVGDIITITN